MYISYFLFYRVEYPSPGEMKIHEMSVHTFGSPQEENTKVREMRRNGYMTKRLNSVDRDLFEAALRQGPS